MMKLFLSQSENLAIHKARSAPPFNAIYWCFMNRVERRAETPGFADREATCDWWLYAAEYLTDAAMAYALKPDRKVSMWLRDAALTIVRRPVEDWIGPSFRDHGKNPPVGNLETAHLAWSLAIVLDLAMEVFLPSEQEEIAGRLKETAIPLCLRWLDDNTHPTNWRCILTAGLAVAAAVTNDDAGIRRAAKEYVRCKEFFQGDGSYGESLQYASYAQYGLMLTREALIRRDPKWIDELKMLPHGKMPIWDAYCLFYQKPLSGWGGVPHPRSANFNDSAAIFRPSGDVLLHLAARAGDEHPQSAGIARWLFETLYLPAVEFGEHDRASFGMVNDFGFLTLVFWPVSVAAISPENAGLPLTGSFESGEVITRDAWQGRTILATRTGSDGLHVAGHQHGDMNSFILVHNHERLLVDPGHSCYRNLGRHLDVSTLNHNTCAFFPQPDAFPDFPLHHGILEQEHRNFLAKTSESGSRKIDRGASRLIVERMDDVAVIGSEAGALYGNPMVSFKRFWILCGTHALFVIDHIVATSPVRTIWSWLLNNRDGLLRVKTINSDRLVVRRGRAGMKLFHLGSNRLKGPFHALVHDAYHPLPGGLGEGSPGSGALYQWVENEAREERTVVHAICLDDNGSIPAWHLKEEAGQVAVLATNDHGQIWKLRNGTEDLSWIVEDGVRRRSYDIARLEEGRWKLSRN
jgi:hypothetical protein